MKTNKVTSKFCIISMIYCSMLLISNVLASKIIILFNTITLPCAVIVFPLVYILSDLMTEVYGIKLSVIAITTNLLLNLFMSVIFMIAIMLPAAPFYEYNNEFSIILGSTPRIILASLLSYYLGDISNSLSLSYLKYKGSVSIFNNSFSYRSILSSLIGQLFDTMGFIFLAFVGTIPFTSLVLMAVYQYIVKILYEVILLPITIVVIRWWKKVENLDTIDEW